MSYGLGGGVDRTHANLLLSDNTLAAGDSSTAGIGGGLRAMSVSSDSGWGCSATRTGCTSGDPAGDGDALGFPLDGGGGGGGFFCEALLFNDDADDAGRNECSPSDVAPICESRSDGRRTSLLVGRELGKWLGVESCSNLLRRSETPDIPSRCASPVCKKSGGPKVGIGDSSPCWTSLNAVLRR